MNKNIYLTQFKAINVHTGDLETWAGLEIEAENEMLAMLVIEELGLDYLKIVGKKIQTPTMMLAMEAILDYGNREN